MDEPLPEIRIGDRERREVDARLQQALTNGVLTLMEYDERAAQCWAARTRRDLDALTRDLPHAPEAPAAADTAAPAPAWSGGAARNMLRRGAGALFAVALAGAGLYGGYQVLTADDGAAIFGSEVVHVRSDQQQVQVGMLAGSVSVVVPDDVRVRTSGTVMFGSIRCEEACRPGPGLREVVVEANGGFGSVTVERPGEQLDRDRDGGSDREDDEDDQDGRDDRDD